MTQSPEVPPTAKARLPSKPQDMSNKLNADTNSKAQPNAILFPVSEKGHILDRR